MSFAMKMNSREYVDHATGRIVRRPSKLKVAVQNPDYAGLVTLQDGSTLTKAKAVSLGYMIADTAGEVTASPAGRPAYLSDAAREAEAARYSAEIMALPEAQDRPATAEKIASAYSFTSLPIVRAAAVLRGMPSEIEEARDRLEAKRAEKEAALEDPKIGRKVELRIATLSLYSSAEHRRERVALSLALNTARESKISVKAALARVGIDATRFA